MNQNRSTQNIKGLKIYYSQAQDSLETFNKFKKSFFKITKYQHY